jgi:DNA-binding GntR family transcriptional regulator
MVGSQQDAVVDPDLPPLPRRSSTAESAAEVLRSQIANGRLVPGAKLREEHVASALSISRNTVREAFRLLSHERLVDHTLHRGVFVRAVSAEDVRSMYLTRRLVEPLGIEAALAAPAVVRHLGEVTESAADAASREDWVAVGTADIEFHRILMSACGSSHLSAMFDRLLAELRLAFLQMPQGQSLHEPYRHRNRHLVDLIEAHDGAAALSELDDYLVSAERTLLDALDPTYSTGQRPLL